MAIALDILRHGRAEPAGENGDAARALSATGLEEIGRLATRLATERWHVDRAFSSPLRRAIQTAERVLEPVRMPNGLETLHELDPERDAGPLAERLAELLEPDSRALVVGHQPLLGQLVAWLASDAVALSPGTLVSVVCENRIAPRSARIERILAPPEYR